MKMTVGLIHPSYIHVLPKGQAEKPEDHFIWIAKICQQEIPVRETAETHKIRFKVSIAIHCHY